MEKDTNLQTLEELVKKIFKERQENQGFLKDKVTVGWPVYDEKEILQALDSLLDLRISQGPKVKAFENACAQYVGTKYAVAVNSGSSANLIAFAALIESGDLEKGSEVIVPAATFSTVASPIIQLGLIPVYVDVDENSWNIDPREIEKAITGKTKVIMPVHSFGNPADMEKIMEIAQKNNLIVFEDCCEAHGARIGDKKVGSFGDLSTLSFFVAHNITTGEGGMVFTNNEKYYNLLLSLREFGRVPNSVIENERFSYEDSILKNYDARYMFTRLGYNLRMTDIEAALGIEQIKKLDALNQARIEIVECYQREFSKYEKFIQLPKVRDNTFHSFYGYPFLIKKDAPFVRSEFVDFLENKNIETRPFFGGCLPDQPGFRNSPHRVFGGLSISRYIRDNCIFIGCHPALKPELVDRVIKVFDEFFSKF